MAIIKRIFKEARKLPKEFVVVPMFEVIPTPKMMKEYGDKRIRLFK